MEKEMKIAVMNDKMDISIEKIEIPELKRGEVLIRIKSVGICGSDLHYYTEGKIGDIEVETPFVLGHEAAGEIVALSDGVEDLKIGDLVAVEPGIPCGACEFCLGGRYNICPDMHFLATPPVDGIFSEYAAYPAKWVFKLPTGMSSVEGALIEPLAVGMHAAEISKAGLGETALIFGCGCIGLLTLLTLKSRGVSQVYMCDIIPSRIEKAYELGAAKVFDVAAEETVKELMKLTGGRGADSVYEMTGTQNALEQTVEAVRKGGTIVLVGLGPETFMTFNFGKLIWKEAQIRTCFRYKNMYSKAINAISSGTIDVRKAVSHTVKLDEVPEALRYHIEHKADIIKMIVEM